MPLGFAKSIFTTSAAGAASMGTAEAVVFDGTNDYSSRSGGITISDGKQGTLSVFYYLNSTVNQQVITNEGNGIVGGFYLQIQSGVGILLQGRDSTNTECLALTDGGGRSTGQWYHVVASWDLAANVAAMYLDDVAHTGLTNRQNQNIAYNSIHGNGDWSIGAGISQVHGIYQKLNGEIGPLYFTDEYIDLTVAANRRKFSNSDGTPADLGADGSIPTGTAAKIFMNGNATYWNAGTNGGTGGAFTMTGSVADSSNEPVDAF